MKSSDNPIRKVGLTAAFGAPCLAALLLWSVSGNALAEGNDAAQKDAAKPSPAASATAPAATPATQTNGVAATANRTNTPAGNAQTNAVAAAPGTNSASATTATNSGPEEILVSFQGANVDMVAQWLAQTTGKSVVKHPRVQCQITITSGKKVSKRDAVTLIVRALALEGYNVTETSKAILIGPDDKDLKLSPELLGTDEIPDGKQKLVKVFALQHIQATELRDKIKGILSEKAVIDVDERANRIIVTDINDNLNLVKELISKLDTEDPPDVMIRKIQLHHVSPAELARVISPLYQRLNVRDRKEIVEVSADERSSSLIVLSTQATYDYIANIVSSLDTETPADVTIRKIPLKYLNAWEAVRSISPLYQRSRIQREVIEFSADDRSNTLIVLSSKANFEAIEKLVTGLDTDGPADISIRKIPLKHITAWEVVRAIVPLYQRMNRNQKDIVEISADDRSNTLIVLSSKANFDSVEKLVVGMDTDSPADITIRKIPLKYINAWEVVRAVAPLYQRMNRTQKDMVEISADDRSNTLIVLSSKVNFESVEKLVVGMDTDSPADITIRKIPLKFINAAEVARSVGPLYQRMNRTQKDIVEISPDERSNTLIVLSSKANFESVQKLVTEMDTDSPADVAIRMIPLKHVNAQDLAREVAPLYQRLNNRGQKEIIEVSANDRSNSLMVLSSLSNFEEIKKLVVAMDTDEAQERVMQLFTLKNADAQDVARQVQELYQDQDSNSRYPYYFYMFGGGNRNNSRKTTVVADRRRNAVIVQATPEAMEQISKMMQTLDAPIDDNSLAPKIYPLKYVSAGDIEDILNELFLKKTQQRSYWFDDAPQQADRDVGRLYGRVRITSEPHANAIIVTANSPENLAAVEEVLKQLDVQSEAGDSTLRVQLKHAKASTVANSLNILFASSGAPPMRVTPAQQQAAVQPQNNQRSDSPQNNFELELDTKEDGYYPWLGGQREPTTYGSRGSRPVSDLVGRVRVVPDYRSNALLISANVHFFPQVLKMVEELDSETSQVLIEAKIVEVSSDFLDKLGVRWSPDGNKVFTTDDYDDSIMVKSVGRYTQDFGPMRDALANATHTGVLDSTINLDFLVQFMRRTTDASVLAEPQINIADNEMGRLFVGSQVPFITQSQTTDVGSLNQSFSYKNVGVILEVTPHINRSGDVSLRIRAESSAIEPGQTLFGGAILDTRNFRTDLTAKNGQTLVLGGIIQKQQAEIIRKVPILGDIPGLGWAFKKKDKTSREVELMVFLRPRVVGSAQDAQIVVDDVNKKTPLIQKWMKEADKPAEPAKEKAKKK